MSNCGCEDLGGGGWVIHILPQKLKNTLMNYRIANHLAIENGRYY